MSSFINIIIRNNLDLGYTSDPTKSKEENKVDNVKLPPWAKSPEEYVFINREALESEYHILYIF
jgi:hypothetical protein